MAERMFNLLFLGAGNSGRSILAESILHKMGSIGALEGASRPRPEVA